MMCVARHCTADSACGSSNKQQQAAIETETMAPKRKAGSDSSAGPKDGSDNDESGDDSLPIAKLRTKKKAAKTNKKAATTATKKAATKKAATKKAATKKAATSKPKKLNAAAEKFLRDGFKEGSIPVDYFEFGKCGSKGVWEAHCKDNPIFDGMEYNDAFAEKLQKLCNAHIKKHQKTMEWRRHPAKKFLKDRFMDGTIPVNYSDQGGPKAVWEAHCQDNPLFKDMEHNDRFTGRQRTIRDDFQKKREG